MAFATAFGPAYQRTEWQHVGNQIDTAFVFAWADFVKVCATFFSGFHSQSAHGHPGLRAFGQTVITPVMPIVQCAAQK